jgi:aminoglycoside phosphotransferase (APT) family kinase protein
MSPTLDITRNGLAGFLSELWADEVTVDELRAASAGARRRNVLFRARTADGEERRLVATIIPTVDLQIMDIEVEAANIRFAEAAGVPVPHVVAESGDDSWVGGAFFVTEQVDGESVPRAVMRLVEATPALAETLARQCGEAFARLHAADLSQAHPDLLGRNAPVGPVRAALDSTRARMDELLLAPSVPFELAHRWLEANAPDEVEPAMVHSDFRVGNIIVGEDGLRAVLDWEVSGVGAPMSDVAWMCVRMWRFGNDQLEVGGIADRSVLREGYESAGGRWDDQAFDWWKLLSTLRWGVGLAGQARQHLNGEFRSIVMAGSGRRVAELESDCLTLLARHAG